MERLYPYQKAFLEDYSQFRGVVKARQIGFSFAIAFEGLYIAEKFKNEEIIYTSVGDRQAKELLKRIKVFGETEKIRWARETASELVLPNGNRLISLPQNPSSVRGYNPTRVYLDEFAHYKWQREMLNALAPSLTRTDRKRFLTIPSTPLGKGDEFYRIINNDKNFNIHSVNILQAIEQGCPTSLDACHALVPDDISFRQEYMCDFVDEATSFFPYELIKQCWNTELRNHTHAELKHCQYPLYAGYDPAKSIDAGVFIVVERRKDKAVVRHIKEWTKTDYSEQLAYIEHYVRGCKMSKLITDQTGVGGKIQEDLGKLLGSVAQGITFTNATKEAMVTNLRVLFQDRILEIPYNQKLVNELHNIQRTVSDSNMVRYAHSSGEHDDYAWALAMACYGFSGRVGSAFFADMPVYYGEELETAKMDW